MTRNESAPLSNHVLLRVSPRKASTCAVGDVEGWAETMMIAPFGSYAPAASRRAMRPHRPHSWNPTTISLPRFAFTQLPSHFDWWIYRNQSLFTEHRRYKRQLGSGEVDVPNQQIDLNITVPYIFSARLYPYGETKGDLLIHGTSEVYKLANPFHYLGQIYDTIYVSLCWPFPSLCVLNLVGIHACIYSALIWCTVREGVRQGHWNHPLWLV